MATYNPSPPRRARRTVLNTIIEDKREIPYNEVEEALSQLHQAVSFPPKTAAQSDIDRSATPLSSVSSSSCSDHEWQKQAQGWDDLYDASDNESQECPSLSSSRPTSTATFATSIRSSTYSTNNRNRYPSLTIPPANLWPSINTPLKSSPVPPTPPPKIPVSPGVLSMLARFVPAVHAPPSLDGSISDDQNSNMSAPPTPEMRAIPDNSWSTPRIRVRGESDAPNSADASGVGTPVEDDLAIEAPSDGWNPLLNQFPTIPGSQERYSTGSIPIRRPHDDSSRSSSPPLGEFVLPEAALATLQHIRLDSSPEPWSETSETNNEMWQLTIPQNGPHSAEDETPHSDLSSYSFSSLSIPSPGGFFSSLGGRARHTWAFPSVNNPPTSAIAERFYNLPWSPDEGQVVEHVIEYPDNLVTDDQSTAVPPSSNGPPTAIRIPDTPTPRRNSFQVDSPISPGTDAVEEIARSGLVIEYDESYAVELTKQAVANLDRTSVWISAQESYLAALKDTNPVNARERPETPANGLEAASETARAPSAMRKSVRFVESTIVPHSPPPAGPANHDSIYWKGFQVVLRQSHHRDIFLHSNTRFDAVQSVRLGLVDKHIDGLLGKYELVRPTRPAYKGPFSQAPRNSVAADILEQQALFSKLEREQMVLAQLCQSVWATDALRFLNGGSLISSPASKRLAKATSPLGTPENAGKSRMRVLDLGGQATCGWAWHLAYDYRNVKIYTVVTKQQAEHINSAIKGPANHRQVSVPCLWKLPFRDNQFDVISARSLHALLKMECPSGEIQDELDLCLQECYRCLKPGGYLEFFVLDAEIARAGPYGQATSVEFQFNLKTRGYDPAPTKKFLSRLRKAQYTSMKRAWMYLPMGVEPNKPVPLPEAPPPEMADNIPLYEAIQGPIGTTADVASMTGLLGGWMWEQWLLKLQMEMGKERSQLLKGMGGVFDEGRKNGSGWTSLCGWAMKPRRQSKCTSP